MLSPDSRRGPRLQWALGSLTIPVNSGVLVHWESSSTVGFWFTKDPRLRWDSGSLGEVGGPILIYNRVLVHSRVLAH